MKSLLLKSILFEVDFDPGHRDHHLVKAAERMLQIVVPSEAPKELARTKGIPYGKAVKAVQYALLYAKDKKELDAAVDS